LIDGRGGEEYWVNRTQVSDIETGRNNGSVEMMKKLDE
jgi:hypothetical protein